MATENVELRQQVAAALMSGICTTVCRSGGDTPAINDESLRPILDVTGFDSQCGIEVTVELEAALQVADLGENIFIEDVDGKTRARTVREVIDAILCVMETI